MKSSCRGEFDHPQLDAGHVARRGDRLAGGEEAAPAAGVAHGHQADVAGALENRVADRVEERALADLLGDQIVTQHVGDVGHLQLGEELPHAADRGVGELERVELDLLDQLAEAAELGGGVDLDRDPALRAVLEKCLEKHARDVVVGDLGRGPDVAVFKRELGRRRTRAGGEKGGDAETAEHERGGFHHGPPWMSSTRSCARRSVRRQAYPSRRGSVRGTAGTNVIRRMIARCTT